MDVLSIHSARSRRRVQGRRTPTRVVPIEGAFRAPRSGPGSLSGFFRPDGFVPTASGTAVTGVFAGELRDAAGERVGLGSRRGLAPVRVTSCAERGSTVVAGPVEIDLMGLRVHVREFCMHLGPVPRPRPWDA